MGGNVVLFGNYFQSLDVVGMLMRYEYRFYIGKRGLNIVQSSLYGACADACVEKDLCIGCFYIYAVSG